MKVSKLFRMVWRANALLIFICGLLAVVLLIIGAVRIGKDIFGAREVRAVVNTQAEVKERLSLADGQRIRGSDHVLVALQSNQEYQQGYFSKSAQAIRNYAFVSVGGEPAWIYPHNKFLFSEATQLPRAGIGTESARAVLFVVKQRDSDGDHRITYRDAGVIALAKPNGEGFKEVVADVVRLVSLEVSGDTLLLIYESSQGPMVASVGLQNFSILKQGPLPMPDNGASR